MGHYWSEMKGPEDIAEERRQDLAFKIAKKLEKVSVAKFTLGDLLFLLEKWDGTLA